MECLPATAFSSFIFNLFWLEKKICRTMEDSFSKCEYNEITDVTDTKLHKIKDRH